MIKPSVPLEVAEGKLLPSSEDGDWTARDAENAEVNFNATMLGECANI